MSTAKTYESWWKTGLAAAIPWLAGGPNGQAEGASWPRLVDDIVRDQITQARYQAYPSKCASDALPHLGGDRKLIQGSNESDTSFRTRLKDAWGQWSRAGTACGVLEQLYYFGLTNAYWFQQNGRQISFSGNPTPGQDPTSLVVAANTKSIGGTISSSSAPYRTIPSGTPWWYVDSNTDLTNRFAIVVTSWPFAALEIAQFNNSDVATVTWPFGFANTSYSVVYGAPSAPVVLSVDGASKTTTTVNINATAPWTGSVFVIGFAAGVNPLNTFTTANLGQLKSIISTFRPNAICQGVFSYLSGNEWGFPTWGNGSNWGGAVGQILGSF